MKFALFCVGLDNFFIDICLYLLNWYNVRSFCARLCTNFQSPLQVHAAVIDLENNMICRCEFEALASITFDNVEAWLLFFGIELEEMHLL